MSLRNELIKLAHSNPDARGDILAMLKAHDSDVVASATALLKQANENYTGLDATIYSLNDALVDDIRVANRRDVTKMVGFTRQKIARAVDAYDDASRELAAAQAEHKAVLDKLKKLKSVQSAALKPLTDAAKQLEEKGQIALQGKQACLNMTVYMKNQIAGIEQMMAEEDDEVLKKNQKAGEMFSRLVEAIGEEAAATAMTVVKEIKEDLSHSSTAVVGVKLVDQVGDKAASLSKNAGILDKAKDAMSWLSGKATRLFNMAGSIKDWVKGFFARTKICKKAVANQDKAFEKAKKEMAALAR